jgi:bidirectional [NiFe] hydrogenase diaphorase subunit
MLSFNASSSQPSKISEGHDNRESRFKVIDRVMKRHQFQQDALIEVLTAAQESFGYLPESVLSYIARQLRLPLSWVYGVATFYHFFSLAPKGRHHCIVCLGTACYVGRSAEILANLEERFGVKAGETTPDGELTLTTTRCLGSCGLAPVVVLDGDLLGRQSPESTVALVESVLGGAESLPEGAASSSAEGEEKR